MRLGPADLDGKQHRDLPLLQAKRRYGKEDGMKGDIKDGVVVRGLSKAGAFTKEEVDSDDRLTEASVNCVEGSNNVSDALVGMNKNNFKKGYAYTTAKKIQQKGGRVMRAPVQGNQNHCQIFGLKLKDANNLFSNVMEWE